VPGRLAKRHASRALVGQALLHHEDVAELDHASIMVIKSGVTTAISTTAAPRRAVRCGARRMRMLLSPLASISNLLDDRTEPLCYPISQCCPKKMMSVPMVKGTP
jgi:hypothetical protein